MSEWERIVGPFGGINYIMKEDGFWISYNPNPGDSFVGLWGSDDGGPETALCYDGRFDILNGDYREAYERLVPKGLVACRKFYMQQSAHADSSWTSPQKGAA